MRRTAPFILALAGLLAAGGGLMGCNESPAAVALEEANARFAWDLYRQVAPGGGNLFFSPYSITSALGMTLLGARGGTQQEMQQVLFAGGDHHEQLGALMRRLTGPAAPAAEPPADPAGPGAPRMGSDQADDEPPFELTVANALWLQDDLPLRAAFLDAARRHYEAEPFSVDFKGQPEAARQRINGWVSDQTRQRIQDLLAPGTVTPATRLVLSNAIYFKSGWQSGFNEAATGPAPFHLPTGGTVEAPLMRQTDRFGYREIEGAQVLRLPYRGQDLAMIVVLPRAHDGLGELEARLTPETLLELAAGRDLPVQRVEVHLPRFRIEQSLDLGADLAALGMPSAFSPGRADFSGLAGTQDLVIDAVVHKAFVAVDEEGTEAAAATAVTVMVTSMPGPQEDPIVFRADRPFLFLITHQPSGTILFLGRVVDPA